MYLEPLYWLCFPSTSDALGNSFLFSFSKKKLVDYCVSAFNSATSVGILEFHFRSIVVTSTEVILCRKMSSTSQSTTLYNPECLLLNEYFNLLFVAVNNVCMYLHTKFSQNMMVLLVYNIELSGGWHCRMIPLPLIERVWISPVGTSC